MGFPAVRLPSADSKNAPSARPEAFSNDQRSKAGLTCVNRALSHDLDDVGTVSSAAVDVGHQTVR